MRHKGGEGHYLEVDGFYMTVIERRQRYFKSANKFSYSCTLYEPKCEHITLLWYMKSYNCVIKPFWNFSYHCESFSRQSTPTAKRNDNTYIYREIFLFEHIMQVASTFVKYNILNQIKINHCIDRSHTQWIGFEEESLLNNK